MLFIAVGYDCSRRGLQPPFDASPGGVTAAPTPGDTPPGLSFVRSCGQRCHAASRALFSSKFVQSGKMTDISSDMQFVREFFHEYFAVRLIKLQDLQ